MITLPVKLESWGKFNNLVYTDRVNFEMVMSTTERCIPQHSLRQPSILDCTKIFAVCVDLAINVDLVQKFVLAPYCHVIQILTNSRIWKRILNWESKGGFEL